MQLMWSKLLLVVPWALGLIPAQRNAPATRVVRLRAAAVVETPAKELLATLTAPEPAARTQLKDLIERATPERSWRAVRFKRTALAVQRCRNYRKRGAHARRYRGDV